MPLPLAMLGGLISTGLNLAGSATSMFSGARQSTFNMMMQQQQNEKDRAFQQHQYDQARADALKDWAMQNQYNSPLEQMNRLRQAGLNPNLVYGKGADATADAVRSSAFGGGNQPAPQSTFDTSSIGRNLANIGSGILQGIGAYQDFKLKTAQTDNVNQSTALMQQESLFKQANTAKVLQDTAKSKFDLEQANALKDSTIEQAKLQNEKLRADTVYTVDNNRRQELANSSNLKLTLEKIITEKIAHAKDAETIKLLKAQQANLAQTNDILRYEQKLTELGIHKSDPWYFRAIMNLVSEDELTGLNAFGGGSGIPANQKQNYEYNMQRESSMMKRKQ